MAMRIDGRSGKLVALLLTVVMGGTACSTSSTNSAGNGNASSDSDGQPGTVPGHPGNPREADQEVVLDALDDLRFDPANVDVTADDTVTFVVKNVGDNPHEFVLGDEQYQLEHEREMNAHHDSVNAIELDPGETGELTWTFDKAGSVLFGCHEPGHYKGGMVGTITVK
ncbi:MAG: hypothetical protein H0W21_04150 [Actinobacteria bacterium]|nr:hypothetical protein [Actinomycetota bacterium]